MCCLFGVLDYNHNLSKRQMNRILNVLSTACEVRGTDATGIAYNHNGKLRIYKRPIPAHLMRFNVPDGVNAVMGHSRMTTQGSEKLNFNNHPFYGKADTLSHLLTMGSSTTMNGSERLNGSRVLISKPTAIISKDVFNQVQKQIASRRRPMKSGKTQIFAGLVKCADCSWSMSYCGKKNRSGSTVYFNCSKFRQLGKAGGQCTAHYVRYDTLYAYVLARLQDWIYQAHTDEKELLNRLLKTSDKESAKIHNKQSAELAKAEKRKIEVDRLFVKLYEDWTSGRISEYNFKMLSQKYQAEQQELVEKIDKLKSELTTEKQTTADAEKWIALIKQYSEPTELTSEMLNTLIEKIVVHEATKDSDGTRTQEIEIFYRFVGKID